MTTPTRVLGLLLATVTFVAVGAASAVAAEPDNPAAWPEEEGRSALETLLFFGGGTLGLIVVIALFGLMTARNNYVPPAPSTDLEQASSSAAAHH